MRLISLLAFFFTTHLFAQSGNIQGRVLDLYTKQPLENAEVELLKKSQLNDTCGVEYFWRKIYLSTGIPVCGPDKSKVVAQRTFTDRNGNFYFSNIDTPYKIVCNYTVVRDTYSFKVYHDMETYDLDSGMIANNTSKGIYILRVTCHYDKTSLLKFCPKCLKKDEIIPMLWGLRVTDLNGNILDDNGKVIEDYHSGGCSPDWCSASKYCKRCDLEF